MLSNNIDADILGRLEAMRAQEEATSPCYNYFQRSTTSKDIDEEGRKTLVIWFQKMQTCLELRSPETAWIATSYLDRYVSSGKGRSQEALQDRHKYQLAAIASFYLAIKIYESAQLPTLAKLCKGYYKDSEIISAEEDILFALDWRVTAPTPMEFVGVFMEFLPERITSAPLILDRLLKDSQEYANSTPTDFSFAFFKPSVVGASCLVSSLTRADILSPSERKEFWLQLARSTDLLEVMDVQNKLLSGNTLSTKNHAASKVTKPRITSKVTPTLVSTSFIEDDHYSRGVKHSSGSDRTLETQFSTASTDKLHSCLLYTSPSPRDVEESRMPSSA